MIFLILIMWQIIWSYLSGDFNSEKIIPLIEQTFGKLRSGKIPEFPEFLEEPFNKRELVEKKLTPLNLGQLFFGL